MIRNIHICLTFCQGTQENRVKQFFKYRKFTLYLKISSMQNFIYFNFVC